MNYIPTAEMEMLPPQNIEMEASLLSTAINCPQEVDVIADLVKPSDFYRTAHRKIFDVILTHHNRQEPIDLASIFSTLKEREQAEEVGGAAFLARLISEPVSPSIEHTCRKVAEKAALREVIRVCQTYTAQAFQDRGEAARLLDSLQRDITKIDIDGGSDEVERVDTLMHAYMDDLEKLSQRHVSVTGHPTGFRLMDYLTCGWQDSDLIILAARPSMGKTALALRFALNMGKQRIPGLIFSLEMSKKQCIMRMAAMESGVNVQKFRNGKLDRDDWEALNRAASHISELPIYIVDTPSLHYNQMRRVARRRFKLDGIRYVMVDHLQLAKGDYPKDPFNDTGSITGPMKALAKELNMPVFVLSQLNRELEKRKNKRPIMADLRNSGNIEQDADIVMFIYRDEYYNDDTREPGVAEVNVSKQRNGPPGMVRMHFKDHCTDFAELARTE